MKRSLPAIITCAFVLALVGGCAGSSTLDRPGAAVATGTVAPVTGKQRAGTEAPARKTAVVPIGLLLPLSGPGQAALIGETMKKAAEMAVADLQAAHVKLIVRDDKGTPDGATAATQQLVADGSEIILGPLFARSVLAAASAARPANVPIVAFSNDRQVVGQGVSLLSFLAEPEIQRAVQYASGRGKKRFAALVPADAYGRLVEVAFRSAVARNGGQIVALETYPPEQANSIAEVVLKFRDSVRGIEEHGDPIDALFLPGGDDVLAVLAPQIRQAQIGTKGLQVIGTGALDNANVGRDPLLQGAWFAAPDPKGWQDFAARYGKLHGHAPPRIASLAYDAVVMAVALSNGADGARYIPGQLTRASGFAGVDGAFRLLADGTTDRGLAILEVQSHGARVIDAAAFVDRPADSGRAEVPRPGTRTSPAESGVLSSIPSAFPPSN